MVPNDLPSQPGVYLITKVENEFEIPYWIEWADNIRSRIHGGLLAGGFADKSFKRELIEKGICADVEEAKQFIRDNCAIRWLRVKDYRFRNALTYFGRAVLLPKCGVLENPKEDVRPRKRGTSRK